MNGPPTSNAERSNVPHEYSSNIMRMDSSVGLASTLRMIADRSIGGSPGLSAEFISPEDESFFALPSLFFERQSLTKTLKFVDWKLNFEDQQLEYRASAGTPTNSPVDFELHLHPDREAIKEEVRSLLDHAGEDDWDGEGAQAISPETVDVAEGLANSLPAGIDKPMISATPHGEVDFDWSLSRDVMLTVSVGPSGDVVFAGLFDETELNGKEPWKGDLPQFIICCLERLKSHRD